MKAVHERLHASLGHRSPSSVQKPICGSRRRIHTIEHVEGTAYRSWTHTDMQQSECKRLPKHPSPKSSAPSRRQAYEIIEWTQGIHRKLLRRRTIRPKDAYNASRGCWWTRGQKCSVWRDEGNRCRSRFSSWRRGARLLIACARAIRLWSRSLRQWLSATPNSHEIQTLHPFLVLSSGKLSKIQMPSCSRRNGSEMSIVEEFPRSAPNPKWDWTDEEHIAVSHPWSRRLYRWLGSLHELHEDCTLRSFFTKQ